MIWISLLLFIISLCAYFRMSLFHSSLAIGFGILIISFFSSFSITALTILWLVFSSVAFLLNFKPLRYALLSKPIFNTMARLMPTISQTEQETLDAGDVWWEAELFSGAPDFKKLENFKPQLSKEEIDFLNGPVEEFCALLDDWKITQVDYDLSKEAWKFAKDNGLFSLIIPKKYGGLDYSALCHSEVVMKIGSRSGSGAVTVMVPNSLGPAKLLMSYGTEQQKDYYLPRLAKGIDIPCFALTGPNAGSDAGAMPDTGVVCYGSFGRKKKVLGIKLNWEKRYITLAPVATLIGLAFKLFDPEHLLGDKVKLGITLALIKRNTAGVEIGNRHFPASQAFMNGPIRGKDVFIPLESIIGGVDYIGKGWLMLMDCLSDGRAISLPALGVAAVKMASQYTGAYARIRQQFHTPIGYFEGVEEALVQIAGQTYAMDASRLLVLSALDKKIVPSVVSGIVKQQLMERMRKIINLAMDIHGGHGVCMGPLNYIGRGYQLIPVGITVEGANILTRSMIIFGQGAMRSHPYLLKEVQAVHNKNYRQGLNAFDTALFSHIGFFISNVVRSFWFGISFAKFTKTPATDKTQYYYQQLIKMSTAFALISDVCILVLGGSLKRREKISGRLADVLSNLYIMSATLKHFENQGSQKDDFILLKWVCEDSLINIQRALSGICKNLPVKIVGKICHFIIFPFTRPYHGATDNFGRIVAKKLLTNNQSLKRLCHGIYNSPNINDATGRISHAFKLVLKSNPIIKKLRNTYKQGLLSSYQANAYLEAKQKKIITNTEYKQLIETEQAVSNAIKVDEFSFKGWKIKTPTQGKTS